MKYTKADLNFILFVCILSVFSSCALRERVPLGFVPVMPESKVSSNYDVQLYAREYAQRIGLSSSAVLTQGGSVARVQKSIDKILTANGFKLGYKAVIVKDNTINASTDSIAIHMHEALLSNLKKESHLDAVVSHELSHISCSHLVQDQVTLRNRKILLAMVSIIAGVAVAVGESQSSPNTYAQKQPSSAGDVTELVGKIGDSIFIKSFSRDQEYEADEVGLMMAAKAGTNPHEIIDFWANASSILGSNSFNILNSTHPSHQDRQENLMRALPMAEKYYTEYLDKEKAILEVQKSQKRKKISKKH